MPEPIVFDIFCGAGGMSEGFLQAGFLVPYASDIHPQAQETYINRHRQLGYPLSFLCADIRKSVIDGSLKRFIGRAKIDVVCGGPPCQGFSLAGKRDVNDPRNQLFKSYIDLLSIVKPNYFVMENVEGILSMVLPTYTGIDDEEYRNVQIADILKNECKKIGYIVEHRVLDSAWFGVPQRRRRVFFFGHKARRRAGGQLYSAVAKPLFPSPMIHNEITVFDAIDDLSSLQSGFCSQGYEKDTNSFYQEESRRGRTPNNNNQTIPTVELLNHETSFHKSKTISRFSKLKEGETIRELLERYRGTPVYNEISTNKNYCIRLDRTKAAPTVLTLPDDIIHYELNRILSVRELARLQSFDDSFVFWGNRTTGSHARKTDLPQYTQVGNAVPPLLAKAVAQQIMDAIKRNNQNDK